MKYGKRRVALFERGALPPPLRQLSTVLVHMSIFPVDKEPNHVLVNEYQPGQGIMPHTDGSAYYERTATLSIGGSGVLLNFVPRLESQQIGFQQVETAAQVLLDGNGSLVIFADDAYSKYTHGIEDSITEEVATSKCANADRGTIVRRGYRISLTFRHHYY
jgi:alkylated DNA repair protein alkB family protein 6